jgi:hypothetical protein
MNTKDGIMFGQPVTIACDGICSKAWGTNSRPRVQLSEDVDDFAFLADGELGDAPIDPRTYEGDCGKPEGPHDMNTWCARECERSETEDRGQPIKLHDFTQRLYNQPWKHERTLSSPT